jgi:hypothetical protein
MAEPQDDRVAFEAWMRRTYAHTQLRRSLDGRGYTDRREDFQWAAWQARASTSIPAGEPVAWTLTETLTKRETTTRGHLWFTDPVNSLWTPLYATPPAPPAPKVVPLSDERIAAEFKRIQGDDAESAAFDFFDFRHGVRFAERAHGIEAALSAAPSDPKA